MNDDLPYDIQIISKATAEVVDTSLIIRAVSETLQRFDTVSAVVSIAVVSDEQIAEFNQEYSNQQGPTDVLAFDLADETSAQRKNRIIDGEIIISGETAQRLADEKAHSTTAELALYAVHGTLHLLGCDDVLEEDARKMHQLEDDILTAVGIGQVYGA